MAAGVDGAADKVLRAPRRSRKVEGCPPARRALHRDPKISSHVDEHQEQFLITNTV
jgi:hypothetical protein